MNLRVQSRSGAPAGMHVMWAGRRLATCAAEFGAKQPLLANENTELVLAEPLDASTGLANRNAEGKAVLVERGNCTFTAKAVHAQAAGANAVIIYNNKEEGPTPMGDAGENEYAKKISIPVVCISQADGVQLAAAINARKTTTWTR